MKELHITKMEKQRRDLKRMISKTMNNEYGSIEVEGTEKTFEITQNDILNNVNDKTAQKSFELKLKNYGKYNIAYTNDGQYLCLGGSNGHLSIIRWKDFRLISETFFKNDYIHDVQFCFNESMLSVAQREAVYIYNTKLTETHVLRKSMNLPLKLGYLPYHFLLTSVGVYGRLCYYDISIGKQISVKETKYGLCDQLCVNQRNGVVTLGHNNGCITMWTPTNKEFVVKMLCHKSKICGLSIDKHGYEMATSDQNGYLKVWDLRTYKEIYSFKCYNTINNIEYSQNGLLGLSTGKTVLIYNMKQNFKSFNYRENHSSYNELFESKYIDKENLYLMHKFDRCLINSIKFCPYEDILGVGHNNGFNSVIIPGSGEANYDIFENDPFINKKYSNKIIVNKLMDKLQPDMIQLNQNFIAGLPMKKSNIEGLNKFLETNNDMKFARKNITKVKKRGYKGVIQRRYAKYQHMKEIHLKQQKLQNQLNVKRDIHKSNLNEYFKSKKNKLKNKLLNDNNKNNDIPDTLQRFNKIKKQKIINKKWDKKSTKIYF